MSTRRVLEFTKAGEFLRTWDLEDASLASGIAVDAGGQGMGERCDPHADLAVFASRLNRGF